MYLEKLLLQNFRNYSSLNIKLNPHVNIIYGNNAQGKTNLLESIYMANYLAKDERINKLYLCLTKIKMLDFYINISFNKKVISYKKFIKICEFLNNIVRLIYGFIKYEKNR